MKIDNKLEICKTTRKHAASSLQKTLEKILKSKNAISEIDFRDLWLKELRKNKDIFPNCWYTPPPLGIGVLFATDENIERVNFPSLRPEKYWPRDNVYLDKKNGIVVTYISPVDKESGVIGDFGLNLYFGKKTIITSHIKKTYRLVNEIFTNIKIGMTLSELFKYEQQLFKNNNVLNGGWISISDPTGINTGHTIPASYNDWTNEELSIIKNKSWENAVKIISSKRRFVNAIETLKIQPGMAFTIEPRLVNPLDKKIPTIYFHTIALIKENGEKELLTDFDEIFKLVGMDYML